MRRVLFGAAMSALLVLPLAPGGAAAQDAETAEDAEATQATQPAQEAEAAQDDAARDAEAQEDDAAPDSEAQEGEAASDAEAQEGEAAPDGEAQDEAAPAGDDGQGAAEARDAQALSDCLIAHAGDEELGAFRDFLTFALTEEPQDVLRQSASAFSGGMIAIGTTRCDMALADFQTEAGRQAAAAYTQHLAQQVMEAAFDRIRR